MQVVIFHGAFGNKNGNWFPWLKKELEKQNNTVYLEQYPVDNWEEITKKGGNNKNTKQNLQSWIDCFSKNTLPKLDLNRPIIFVGHSLAPVFILHLIEKYKIKLASAIFVSPFLTSLNNKKTWQFDVVNNTFYKDDFNWEYLKKMIYKRIVVYGEKDPYVPTKYPLEFAKKINAEIIPIKNGDHLGENYNVFPLIKNICNNVYLSKAC